MSIFNVDWRGIFNIAIPPVERVNQTLDLGESLLITLKGESDSINELLDETNAEVSNACITMVLRALLNREFGETTFEVETNRQALQSFFLDESEVEYIYFYDESEPVELFLVDETETDSNASITIRVPSSLFSTKLGQIDEFVKIRKVAGKSYEIVSL